MTKEDYKIAYENVMTANYLLDKEIERLKEENKKYNKWIEGLNKDNHRLNNIINELEKWLKERVEKLDIIGYDDDIFNGLELALQKLKELKGSDKLDQRSNN